MADVERICSIEGCSRRVHARGWCEMHYRRWQRQRREQMGGAAPEREQRRFASCPPIVRFVNSIEISSDGCWIWTAAVSGHGYGEMQVGRRTIYAHRWVYEHYVAPIPDTLTIDHLCHNRDPFCSGGYACQHRRCVNPAHLEPVTVGENIRRGRERLRLR